MINPSKITDFFRTDAELEEFLLFAIVVAGKTATTQAKKLGNFLNVHYGPFAYVQFLIEYNALVHELEKHRLGKYRLIEKAFKEVIKLNPRTCTLQELIKVPGIGLKTAKFFLCHSRAKERHAVLDTHILKWLDSQGWPDLPKISPQNLTKYTRVELMFFKECELAGKTPAELDLAIWNEKSNKK